MTRPYERVRALQVIDALPETPTGKVRKTELRGLMAELSAR